MARGADERGPREHRNMNFDGPSSCSNNTLVHRRTHVCQRVRQREAQEGSRSRVRVYAYQ